MSSLLEDYRTWHWLQVETRDLDPIYDTLRVLSDQWGLDQQQRAWLCVCHVAYYHVSVTVQMFERCPTPLDIPETEAGMEELGLLSWPTGIERRGHRTPPPLIKHLAGLRRDLADDPLGWLGADGWDWPALNARITELQGNGRWAAYKLAEMLQKVADVPTVATDAGHRNSSGPRKGLSQLFEDLPAGQDAGAIAQLDELTEELRSWVGESDVAQIETSLCSWNSLVGGRFYLGRDIDVMQEDMSHPRVEQSLSLWEARRAALPSEMLGEVQGWPGQRKELKRLYADQGILDWREKR